jgi:HAD superfamily hydrolase (TIGR01484 family)
MLVFDIDGVLTGGEATSLDHHFLAGLADMNRAARQDPTRPPVTLCTGRPAPYLEVMLQAIDGHLPGIFENGTGLYDPATYQFLPHPELKSDSKLNAIRERLDTGLVHTGKAYFQPGKIYSLTLFSVNPQETRELHNLAEAALGPLREEVDLVYSTSCLNIIPNGIDKGKGIQYLARYTNYSPSEMLGVGDSDVDLPFLALIGYTAAPYNANPAVKQLVQYVSPHPTSAGVMDILEHFGIK